MGGTFENSQPPNPEARHSWAGRLTVGNILLMVPYTIAGSSSYFNWERSAIRPLWLLLGLVLWVLGPFACAITGFVELVLCLTRRGRIAEIGTPVAAVIFGALILTLVTMFVLGMQGH